MATLSAANAKKLIAHLGQELLEVLHHDPKAGFTLVLDAAKQPHLLAGLAPVPGVTLTTAPFTSVHWGNTLVRVPDLAAFLGDATRLDQRAMRWKGGAYVEVVRFGRRVLVCSGGNNMRNLKSVGLTFEKEAEAQRFFTSFASDLPKGWVDTGPVYVAGAGGISREYLASAAQRDRTGQHAAVVRVLDAEVRTTIVDPTGKRTEQRQRYPSEAEALAALNAFELQWYLAGGEQYEIEFMDGLKRRADRTLLEHLEEELAQVKDPAALVREVLRASGLALPEPLPTDVGGLQQAVRALHPTHWLRVGEQLPTELEHIEGRASRHEQLHLYVDRTHRTAAVILVDERRQRAWAKVMERVATDQKLEALFTKLKTRFKVA